MTRTRGKGGSESLGEFNPIPPGQAVKAFLLLSQEFKDCNGATDCCCLRCFCTLSKLPTIVAEPFSVFAGAVGVAGATLKSIKALLEVIQAIKNLPEATSVLKEDLSVIEIVLETLDTALHGSAFEALSPDVTVGLALAIQNCKRACDNFRTKHSTDYRIHWWGRVRVGLFAEAEIKVLSEQLNRCKDTVNSAVSTATLVTTARATMNTENIKSTLLTQKGGLTGAIIKMDKQVAEVELSSQTLSVINADQTREQAKDEPTEIVEELREEHAALCSSRKVLKDPLAEIYQPQIRQKISNVHLTDGGRLQVGLINTQGRHGQVDHDLSTISAKGNAKGIVGVAEGVDLNAFFR